MAGFYIEVINGPMLIEKATPAEHKAELDLTVKKGGLELHESGTYLRVDRPALDLFPTFDNFSFSDLDRMQRPSFSAQKQAT